MEDQKKNSLLDDDLSLEELAKNFDNIDCIGKWTIR